MTQSLLLQLRAGVKYLLSITRSDWQLADYPVRFRHFNVSDTGGRLKQVSWSCQIINWWQMDGFGDTHVDREHGKTLSYFS